MKNRSLIKNPWITVKRNVIYKDRFVKFRVDDVIEPNGEKGKYSLAEKRNGVSIVALDERENIYLIREWKYPIGEYIRLVPAGGVENGEKPIEAAKRELKEEAGIKAQNWQSLGYFYSSNGTITEKAYMFLATGISKAKRNLDKTERIEIRRVKFNKALEMVLNGKITDGYAVVSLMKTHFFLNKEKSK